MLRALPAVYGATVVFGVFRTELERTPRESAVLLGVYVLLVTRMVAETRGLTAFAPGLGP